MIFSFDVSPIIIVSTYQPSTFLLFASLLFCFSAFLFLLLRFSVVFASLLFYFFAFLFFWLLCFVALLVLLDCKCSLQLHEEQHQQHKTTRTANTKGTTRTTKATRATKSAIKRRTITTAKEEHNRTCLCFLSFWPCKTLRAS